MSDVISPRQFHDSQGVEDWRVLGEGAFAYFRAESFEAGAILVEAIGKLADLDGHLAGMDVRQDGVTVRLITVASGYRAMSRLDAELARQISAIAKDQGLAADPSRVQDLLVIPGSPIPAEVMPFWQAVLGYERRADSPDEDLVDPRNRGSSFWFERGTRPSGGSRKARLWRRTRASRRRSPTPSDGTARPAAYSPLRLSASRPAT
jgi:4a-hydroxytetrahydrobiopterin dehydratase